MKVPISWLKSLVDFKETTDILMDKLTFAGLEVEAIEKVGSKFEGIVVAEILEITDHPNADKLKLCLVDYGCKEPIRVVCGAPNVEIGGKYPFAPVGTTLPGGFTLKAAKIRGEVSMGMLCAKDELGLGADHSGLMELDKKLKAGELFVNVAGEPEEVIELEITPNRPDCLSVNGIAREVAAITNSKIKIPAINLPDGDTSDLSIKVEDKHNCPRYTARVIKEVKIGPSPEWIKKRLELVGIKSINNVVDITNYVMLETGHPLHAFDFDYVNDKKIFIRSAKKDEIFVALDKTQHVLNDDMLVIANNKEILALAGIIGGLNSEIKESTCTVLLEAAAFCSTSVRSTAKKLGLSTDSSYRFQRGISSESVHNASKRATELIIEYAHAGSFSQAIDIYKSPKPPNNIKLNWESINSKIGISIPIPSMKDILKRLEIEVINDDGVNAEVLAPSFRLDLEREIDLVEEIARLYGVNMIPDNLPYSKVIPGSENKKSDSISFLRGLLQGLGVSEIMNYTLVNHSLLDLFSFENRELREELPHPISMDQSVLRPSLIPQLIESFGRNNSRQVNKACFYEIGKIFQRNENKIMEKESLSIGIMGSIGRMPLDTRADVSNEEQFLWIKGLIEELFNMLGLARPSYAPCTSECFEENQAISISLNGVLIGKMGLISEIPKKEWRLNTPISAAELSLHEILSSVNKINHVEEIPIYPSISRDLALVVNIDITHASIEALINKNKPKMLESFDLFDIYKGNGIKKDKKSMAYNFVYRSLNDTLTDKRVNKVHQKLIDILCTELSAEIRV